MRKFKRRFESGKKLLTTLAITVAATSCVAVPVAAPLADVVENAPIDTEVKELNEQESKSNVNENESNVQKNEEETENLEVKPPNVTSMPVQVDLEEQEEEVENSTTHTCPGTGVTDAEEFTSTGGELAGGSYYLAEDITLTGNITIASGKTVNICLNGKVLNLNGYNIQNNGILNIYCCDSTTVHKFTADANGMWVLDEAGGNMEVTGGVITGGKGSKNIGYVTDIDNGRTVGGAIANNGTVSLSNVNLVGNKATRSGTHDTGKGGALFNAANAILNVTDSTIAGNYSDEQGAGIFGKSSSFININRCSIHDNTAAQYGAGISSAANMTIENSSITGNKISGSSRSGAGLDWWGGALTLKGKVVINNNTTGESDDNLFMEFDDQSTKLSLDGLTGDSEIHVWHKVSPLENDEVIIANANDNDYSSNFVSDTESCSVIYDDNNQLVLQQTEFWVSEEGDDSSGDGSESNPYKSINKAVERVGSNGIIKLSDDTALTENCNFDKDITIDLNGHNILLYTSGTTSYRKFQTDNGSTITFLVDDATDLDNARLISQKSESDVSYVWKLTDNITVDKAINIMSTTSGEDADGILGNYKKITIDGQGQYSITGENSDTTGESQKQVFYFRNNTAGEKAVEFKDVTINVGNGFGSGICFDKQYDERPSIVATLNNLTVNMNQTIAPKKLGDDNITVSDTLGVPIIDNYSNVTVKNNLVLKLGKYTAVAFEVDAKRDDSSLTFDSTANVAITDNRSTDTKNSMPIIHFDHNDTNTCTATGNYVTNKLGPVGTSGYNYKATVTFDSKGGSAVPGVITAVLNKLTKPDDPVCSGCKFGGWYTDQKYTEADKWDFDTDVVLESNLTLYAKWISDYKQIGDSDCEYCIDENGVLTIRPMDGAQEGTLPDGYTEVNNWPWYSESESIKGVKFEKTVKAGNSTRCMFYNFKNLTNIDFTGFNTSNVTNMSWMFSFCSALTGLDLTSIDTSNVTDMSWMFSYCNDLTNLNLTSLKTSNVTDMKSMFFQCEELESLDLTSFDTSNVTDMNRMFAECKSFTSLDLSSFDTSKVTAMNQMFEKCESLISLYLSEFDTSNVTDMSHMFYNCSDLTTIFASDLWSTENVTESYQMFENCEKLEGGKNTVFDSDHTDKEYARIDGGTENPGYLTSVFTRIGDSNCEYYIDSNGVLIIRPIDKTKEGTLPNDYTVAKDWPWHLDRSEIKGVRIDGAVTAGTSMAYMFSDMANLTNADLTNLNTISVNNMTGMFENCSELVTIKVRDGWRVLSVNKSDDMFTGCTKITGGKGTTFDPEKTDMEYARIDRAPDDPGYLTKTEMADFEQIEWSDCEYMVDAEGNLIIRPMNGASEGTLPNIRVYSDWPWYFERNDIKSVKIENTVKAGKSITSIFFDCENLTDVDLTGLDTSDAENMRAMFYNCKKLEEIDLSSLDTSNVTTMMSMFKGCSKLKTIKVLDKWNVENVTSSAEMFNGCTDLIGGKGTAYDAEKTDAEYAHIDKAPENPGYLTVKYDGWTKLGDKTYYYKDGAPLKDWQTVDGNRYWFDHEDGSMHTNDWYTTEYGNLYYVGEDGVMYKGWHTIDSERYWFDKEVGRMQRSKWYTTEYGNLYYVGSDGVMYKGWHTIDGKRYWFDKEVGRMQRNKWYTTEYGNLYYVGSDGVMYTGWKTIGSDRYWFAKNGCMHRNEWYTTEYGNKYYVLSDGKMAKNSTYRLTMEDGSVKYCTFSLAGRLISSR